MASIDIGVDLAPQLLAAADAAVLRDDEELAVARAELVDAAGPTRAARAFACIGNFQMMNRLLDGLGVGPHPRFRSVAEVIGVTIPDHFASG